MVVKIRRGIKSRKGPGLKKSKQIGLANNSKDIYANAVSCKSNDEKIIAVTLNLDVPALLKIDSTRQTEYSGNRYQNDAATEATLEDEAPIVSGLVDESSVVSDLMWVHRPEQGMMTRERIKILTTGPEEGGSVVDFFPASGYPLRDGQVEFHLNRCCKLGGCRKQKHGGRKYGLVEKLMRRLAASLVRLMLGCLFRHPPFTRPRA